MWLQPRGGSALQRRKWDAHAKTQVVLQGLKGPPIAELCNEHQISQSQYYRWRDQFLANAAKAFNVPQQTRREVHMAREIVRLKTLVGELTLELKKSDAVFA